MANIRVKDLPNTSAPAADTDEFIIDSSSAGTRRLNYGELKTAISGDFQSGTSTYKVATLGSDNKLDPAQIPDTLSQGLNFVGVANSAGDLTSTTQGDFYVIQTAFGVYSVGDQAVYDGSAYIRVTDGTKQISEGGTGATTLDAAKTNLEIIDVGSSPNQVSLNGMLGDLAFQSSDGLSVAELQGDNIGLNASPTDARLTITDSTNDCIHLTADESTIQGPYADTQIRMGGNIVVKGVNNAFLTTGSNAGLAVDSAGRVGIGNATPSSYNAAANSLVVGDHTTNRGITIASSNAHTGYLFFADGTGANAYRGRVAYNHAADQLYLGAGGSTSWKIDGATGNLIAVQSGAAIDFGSVAEGSGTPVANGGLLDDYESGSLTATLTPSGSGTITVDSSTNTLRYVKVGNLVSVTGKIAVSAVSSPVGSYVYLNLPFTVGSATGNRTAGTVLISAAASNANTYGVFVPNAGSTAYICSTAGTSLGAGTTGQDFSGNEELHINISYIAA